jgi:hypothetical protein
MINPSLYKSIKDQSGVESLLVLDDKGFVTYSISYLIYYRFARFKVARKHT